MESYTRECVFGQGKVNEKQPLYVTAWKLLDSVIFNSNI